MAATGSLAAAGNVGRGEVVGLGRLRGDLAGRVGVREDGLVGGGWEVPRCTTLQAWPGVCGSQLRKARASGV